MQTGLMQKPTRLKYLRSILIAYLRNNKRLSYQKKYEIPPVVDSYHLIQSIEKKHGFVNFYTGIYGRSNKNVFIKTWQGTAKDVNYYLLLNEYNAMKILESTQPKKHTYNIYFPKLYGYVHTTTQLSIIYEYIQGKQLATRNATIQCKVLEKSLQYLEAVSRSLTKEQRRQIPVRSAWFYLFSLPIITYFVLLTNRKHTNNIVVAFWRALRTYPYRLPSQLILAHADINPHNVLLAKNKIYLLDGERLRFTLPGFDKIHMLVARGNSPIRSQLFSNSKNFLSHNAYAPFLLLYICLQYILSTNHVSETKKYYLQILPRLLSINLNVF